MNAQERRLELVSRLQGATKLEPATEITLKGSVYRLEFNNYAMRNLFKATGIDVMKGFDPKKLNEMETRTAFIYWGLKTHHPELTEEEGESCLPLSRRTTLR